jgi:ADP-heptose:LPS heptosyltransferase
VPGLSHYAPRGEQILIIKLGAMGDVLRTKSLLPALKRAHPTSWIVWLTAPGSESIARDPLVDEVRTLTTEGVMSLEHRPWTRVLCLDKDPHALALSAKLDAKIRQGFAPTPYNTVTVWNDAATDALRLA